MAKPLPLIAGNWKMHKTQAEARELAREICRGLADRSRPEVVLAPPYTALSTVAAELAGSPVGLAAQDTFWERQGAFTGAISPLMLKDAGCRYVIVGHSERRQLFGETNATVNLKLKAALDAGLSLIFCVGETRVEREGGRTMARVGEQLVQGLAGLSGASEANLVVAYEPVWAIGTGLTATPEMANDAHQLIRREAANNFGDEFAAQLRILYGGSVKPENVNALLTQEEIDGALVGGASLKPESFSQIVHW
jgi:triosephosphate isomerase